MMKFMMIFSCVLAIFIQNVSAQELKPNESALKLLQTTSPGIDWDNKTQNLADVTCDKLMDTILVGYAKNDEVWVGIVPGSNDSENVKPMIFKFRVGKQSQDSFCGIPVRVETSPITCSDEEIGTFPGCRPIKGCKDFSLIDDMCDSFHFYWDATNKKLVWWRR